MTNWDELKRLAEEATGGDWYAGNAYDKRFIAAYQVIVKIEEGNYVILEGNQNFIEDANRNVAYVAAANPKTILELIAENERLRDIANEQRHRLECLGEGTDGSTTALTRIGRLEYERDQLRAEVEALRKDAERYRHLKDQGHFRAMSIDMGGNHSWTGMGRHVGKGQTVDEAIDSEIARIQA